MSLLIFMSVALTLLGENNADGYCFGKEATKFITSKQGNISSREIDGKIGNDCYWMVNTTAVNYKMTFKSVNGNGSIYVSSRMKCTDSGEACIPGNNQCSSYINRCKTLQGTERQCRECPEGRPPSEWTLGKATLCYNVGCVSSESKCKQITNGPLIIKYHNSGGRSNFEIAYEISSCHAGTHDDISTVAHKSTERKSVTTTSDREKTTHEPDSSNGKNPNILLTVILPISLSILILVIIVVAILAIRSFRKKKREEMLYEETTGNEEVHRNEAFSEREVVENVIYGMEINGNTTERLPENVDNVLYNM